MSLLGIGLAAVAWCAVLATLVLVDSNPVALNRAQILNADVVIQGDWIAGSVPRLKVVKTWKGTWTGEVLELSGALPSTVPTGEVLVPVTFTSAKGGEVTHGVMPNPLESAAAIRTEPPRPSEVLPLVYPATADALRQLNEILDRRVP